MNHCGIQQKNTFASFDKGEHMVCPKPRRLSLFNTPMNEPVRPLRWHMCYQPESYESKAGVELLEIIFEKGGGYGKTCTQAASSPPFFSGSPPSRVSNPLIQDTRFGDEKVSPVSVVPVPASGMSSSEREVGGSFGNKPAVRIEGFNCGRGNGRNSSVPALA